MKTQQRRPISMWRRGTDFLAQLALVLLLSFMVVQNAFADVLNDATANGTYLLAPVGSGNSFVSIPVVPNAPAIELLKSSTFNDESGDGYAQLGETISYAFTVQNTGNVTLTNVVVTDPTVTVAGGPIASLAPAASDSTTFTATYTLGASDLLALQVTNSATVTGTPPSGPNITDVSDSQNPGDDTGADDDVTVTSFSVPIDAVADDFSATPINGGSGGATATVYTNDTLNGAAFAPAAVTPSITANGGIAGLTINPADGTLSIPAGTAAATYTVTYQICEVLNPANCDTANVTVVVVAPVIDAIADDFSATPINGGSGGATATVYTNDTLNGAAFAPAAVTPSITANGGIAGLTINPADGTLSIPAGTAAATYTVTYQICEVLNPANCDTANVTVVVVAPVIDAIADDFSATPINGGSGGATATVYTNDTLNGAAFAPAAVTPSITANGGIAGLTINPADGTLSIPAGTAAATYTVTYQICEVLNPANCDTANVTVVVVAPVIDAIADDFSATPINGGSGGATATVYTNDTLNGAAFAPAAVTPSITANGGIAGLTINPADGTLSIPAGTAAATYTVTYQICEVLNPANCDTANVTVVVVAPVIDAIADDFSATPINGGSGGATATVYTNDTLNGAAFAPAAVTPSITANGGIAGLTINPADGTLSIPAGTAAATYTVTYQICEVLNPANCDTANVTVVVVAPVIDAIADDFSATPINGGSGGATATVYTNDTLNGAAFAPAAVTPSITANGGIAGLTINPADGTLSIPAGTAAATYTVTYQICEVLNPANCDTANVTVVVVAPVIDAIADDFSATPINGGSGGATATVYTNDTLNGAAFAPAAVTPSITANGGIAGLTINPADGTLSIPAGTAAATYTVTYQICEVLNPANCDTANVTVVVVAPVIDAIADDFSATPINGGSGGATATVYTNDTLNGAAFAPAAVTPSITANGGIAGLTINPADGTLSIPAGTAAATYTVTYQICEVLNPANCDTANVTVVVVANPTVMGTVYFDLDGNGVYGGADLNAGAGDIVQLVDSGGAVVANTTTNASGAYSLSAAPGAGYSLMFRRADLVALGTIAGLTLTSGVTIVDQNQPIDPSGIVYDSVTRAPVAGVTVTITDGSDTPLPVACLIDPTQQNQVTVVDGAYQFDIVPGSDPACPAAEAEYRISVANPAGYVPGPSVTMPPQAGPFDVTPCAVLPAACQIVPSAAPPVSPAAGFYYLAFLLEPGDANVVNNHIAIDPLVSIGEGLTKRALVTQARRGEQVPYVVEVEDTALPLVRVVDTMPPGFNYVAGSATVNGVAQEPVIAGRELIFDGLVPVGGDITIELTLIATVAVTPGPYVNVAQLIDPATDLLVSTARAAVTIVAEHVFDCGDVIGKVFDDRNRNGSQDDGEPGLAGVRLVTVKGVLITTDKHGRFHVACADIPDADIGSNFILKLDTRTLPTGFKMTTANPRIVRLTAGKMSKMNFGAAITRLVRFDMTEEAFIKGSDELKPQWQKAINKLMAVLKTDKSSLRLTYFAKTRDKKLAADRIVAVEQLISTRWASEGGAYRLAIETRVMGAK